MLLVRLAGLWIRGAEKVERKTSMGVWECGSILNARLNSPTPTHPYSHTNRRLCWFRITEAARVDKHNE